MLSTAGVRRLLACFDLGSGQLSPGPVDRGVLGEIWRLDTTTGRWAVKVATTQADELDNPDGVALQEAAVRFGVTAPVVRRTVDGSVVAVVEGRRLRVQSWVDASPARVGLDAQAVGSLLAALHRAGASLPTPVGAVHQWYTEPVGADAWEDLVARSRAAGAPYTAELERLREDLVRLESSYLRVSAWAPLLVGHRDLYADNVRLGPAGLVVYDFDNAGPFSPTQELGMVLAEFATDAVGAVVAGRARTLVEAYEDAGGPGQVRGPGDLTAAGASLLHIVQMWGRQWLGAADTHDDGLTVRAERGVREFLDRPLTPDVVSELVRIVR